MSDKDFIAGMDPNARRSPSRVVFVTRRTSPQVKLRDELHVMTYPEALFRAIVAIEIAALALVWISLLWNAPLEELANPHVTPNPAKAPWYFLGLQELLHYFPPVVAGVLLPGLVVLALVVIPYAKVNLEAGPLWAGDPRHLTRKAALVAGAVAVLLFLFGAFGCWPVVVPTAIVAAAMF